jgi:hypothetical protein
VILLIKLILAHILGDFVLQPRKWVIAKEQNKLKAPQYYFHLLIHAALLTIILADIAPWPLVLLLVASHGAIDAIKLHFQSEHTKRAWFFVDQLLHLISIVLLWLWWDEIPIQGFSGFANHYWIVFTAGIFLTQPMAIIMSQVLRDWSHDIAEKENESLAEAGKYIGMLERLLVFAFVLLNALEAIGFLLAAKSIFRFGDLRESKERKLTEYILIGTLWSFGSAMAIGLLVKNLIGNWM